MREPISIIAEADSARLNFKTLETLTGHRTLTVGEIDQYQGFAFDPGGAGRNLVLPPEEACKGTVLFVSNKADAAEVLTIQNDAAGTVCTPTQGETAICWCDGSVWHGLVGANS